MTEPHWHCTVSYAVGEHGVIIDLGYDVAEPRRLYDLLPRDPAWTDKIERIRMQRVPSHTAH